MRRNQTVTVEFLHRMSFVIWILASSYLAGTLVLTWALLHAPEGYEDERGFQRGRQPMADDPIE